MKSIYIRAALFFLFTLAALVPYSPAAASGSEEATLLAFRVEPPAEAGRAVAPSYIIGTAHLKNGENKNLLEHINVFLASSEVAVFESREVKGEVDQSAISDLMFPNVDMRKLYKPETWKFINNQLESSGIKLEYMPFKPWAVFVLLAQTSLEIKKGEIMDMIIYSRAREMKKKICFLESNSAYIFDRIPLEAQIDYIERQARGTDQFKNNSRNELESYFNGDLSALEKTVFEVSPDSREAMIDALWVNSLIVERNKLWMPLIEKHIRKGNCFIAFGAGHLVGKPGILAALREKNYSVIDVSVIKGKKR